MENEKIDGGATIKTTVSSKLENFWYHYKWHTLIALFVVFVITVCTLQMCEKESYDTNVLYAGGHAVSRQNEEADYSEYQKLLTSFKSFSKDYNEDGKVSVSLRDLYTPTEDELRAAGDDVYYSRFYEDKEILTSTMMTGGYFLCFFSPEVFESYDKIENDGARVFADLSYLVPDGVTVEYYNDAKTGIKLSSLGIYSLSGISSLPENTVVCLRNTSFSTHLDDDKNERDYTRAKEMLVKMLSFDAE